MYRRRSFDASSYRCQLSVSFLYIFVGSLRPTPESVIVAGAEAGEAYSID